MCLVLRASGPWLRYAALQNFDPFLSLDCIPTPSTLTRSKERKGSNFAIWQPWPKEPKLLARKIKDLGSDEASSDIPGEFADMPEMKPLSNRFSFFEHFEEKKEAEEEKHRRQKGQRKARTGSPKAQGEGEDMAYSDEEVDPTGKQGGNSTIQQH